MPLCHHDGTITQQELRVNMSLVFVLNFIASVIFTMKTNMCSKNVGFICDGDGTRGYLKVTVEE